MVTEVVRRWSRWHTSDLSVAHERALGGTRASSRWHRSEDAFCHASDTRHSHANRVPRPADMPSPMSTHDSAPLPTPLNLFPPYRKCGHASRSQDIHPQHQHSAEQRSPSLELGPIDPRFHRPGAIGLSRSLPALLLGRLLVFQAIQRQGMAPSVIMYNSVISACKKGNRPKQALEVFQAMQ